MKHCFLAIVLLIGVPAQSLTIHPIFEAAVGESWDQTRRGVIEQAMADWETAILDDHSIEITFTFTNAGSDKSLAQWSASVSAPLGIDLFPYSPEVTHTVQFNADRMSTSLENYIWWDPTPTTFADQPFESFDALSVARHELGHALGFTSNFYADNFHTVGERDKWEQEISGTTFDSGGLNVTMASDEDLAHVAASGKTADDLMVVAVRNNTRREISQIDLDMLSLVYGYNVSTPVIPGDTDNDGDVDFTDFSVLAGNFTGTITPPAPPGTGGKTRDRGDFDEDGDVDFIDFSMLAGNFSGTITASLSAMEGRNDAILLSDEGSMAAFSSFLPDVGDDFETLDIGQYLGGDLLPNSIDNTIYMNGFLETTKPVGAMVTIPEPASGILLALGCLILSRKLNRPIS